MCYFIIIILTATFCKDGGTFGSSGIKTHPKFSLDCISYTLNQSMSKTVVSPTNSSIIVSFK